MKPSSYYLKKLATGEILPDRNQELVVEKLDQLYEKLLTTDRSFLSRLRKKTTIKGIYLWGNVGIGKTFLMDTFYYSLPFEQKLRIHFHKFMQKVHHDLAALQGHKNPLNVLGKELANTIKVLCLDELLVNDIADAMILAKLFKALIDNHICLLITANTEPNNLYLHGLQREQFLPAIELIKNYMEIIHLYANNDYRATASQSNKFYWSPLTAEAYAKLASCFTKFSNNASFDEKPLFICEREIKVKKKAESVVWFDFMDICGIPRSQEDYLAIAESFHTVLISNLTQIHPDQNDLIRSFIKLVDVFYDAKIRLIIAAAQPIDKIYTAGRLIEEFARTRSRITQMQSADWVLSK